MELNLTCAHVHYWYQAVIIKDYRDKGQALLLGRFVINHQLYNPRGFKYREINYSTVSEDVRSITLCRCASCGQIDYSYVHV